MNKTIKFKNLNPESGVSLIITFFIMIIILAVVLSVSTLLYSEIKVVRNIGNSMVAFYAADSGIEKVLYFDYQVMPISSDEKTVAKRGLCSMYPYNYSFNYSSTSPTWTNPAACPEDNNDSSEPDISMYCMPDPGFQSPQIYNNPSAHPDGCDPSVCDDCQISFSTALDNGATYTTIAEVFPSLDNKNYEFEIKSKGTFNGAERRIQIFNSTAQKQGVIKIENACVSPAPPTYPQGTTINISADVSIAVPGSTDTIGSVTAIVYYYDSNGNVIIVKNNVSLSLDATNGGTYTSGTWRGAWSTSSSTPTRAYYVDLVAIDTLEKPNEQKCVGLLSGYLCIKSCR